MIRLVFILVVVTMLYNCSTREEKSMKTELADEDYEKHYELKAHALEEILGKAHDMVGHAIIPFDAGGTVDMYYYPNAINGTGLATMELIQPDGSGPMPNRNGTYELLAFTKHKINADTTATTPFNIIERRICGIFTAIGLYSVESKLEPGETMEIPDDDSTVCIVFDEYKPEGKEFTIGNDRNGLLLVLEIHRDEMEFAMENGSDELLKKLKEKGYYPYSDIDRPSVLN